MVPRLQCNVSHGLIFGILTSSYPSFSPDIIVANGSTLAVTDVGQHTIPTSSQNLSLRNILVSPHLIKYLISVKTLMRDNPVNMEFDVRGFSFGDRRRRQRSSTVIHRTSSTLSIHHTGPKHPTPSLPLRTIPSTGTLVTLVMMHWTPPSATPPYMPLAPPETSAMPVN